jgi:Bacterial SH3 domain
MAFLILGHPQMVKLTLGAALAAAVVSSAYAQTPDIINWCNRYNRNPVAAARCIGAETQTQQPQQQAMGRLYHVTMDSLNVRDGPGTNHRMVGMMPHGTIVSTYGCAPRDDGIVGAEWCQVAWNGVRGWASTGGMVPIQAGVPSGVAGAGMAGPTQQMEEHLTPNPPQLQTRALAAQQEIELPIEFTGRWATVYQPICAMIGGCSPDHPMKMFGLPRVVGLTGSHLEADKDSLISFKVFPDPLGRSGYVLVENMFVPNDSSGANTVREIWKMPYRYGGHEYVEKVNIAPKFTPEEARKLRRDAPELGATLDQWEALPGFKNVKAAPQMTVLCRLAEGTNDCE